MRSKKRSQHHNDLPPVDEDEELARLEERVVAEAPERGTQPFTEANSDPQSFSALPLSERTVRGLKDGKFMTMTEIQVAALPHALAGRDVLGAAKTGSGKTIAFLVPLVENLYRSRITFGDGLAALVISPTRELALQIFEVLRVIGKRHNLSAGLITGGKKEFREEQLRVPRMNILIATPGRLLQHLEQTPGFDVSFLQVLVLDEADRILDLGFKEQLNDIISYLPSSRQTMLFSATQTRSIRDLARLSLNKRTVEYVAVQDGKEGCATPAKLVQNYVVCSLERKLDVVLGFIKTHLRSKMIIFFSSCTQVRFIYELFCALQPGTPLLALHGKCKHAKRTQIYLDFVRRPGAVLLATDIAARGLDFPDVDWVIQVDAPEDAEGYIHRVGRTARYTSGGRALLILLPSEEEGMLAALAPKHIPIKKLTINPDKVRMSGSVSKKAAATVAADPEKKRLAEKAFTSYVRSVRFMHNKQIFRVSELPLEEYATSLGLVAAPSVPGLALGKVKNEELVVEMDAQGVEQEREMQRRKKNVNRSLQRLKEQIKAEKLRKKLEREGEAARTPVGKPKSTSRRSPLESQASDGEVTREDQSSEDEDGGGLVLVHKRPLEAGGAAERVEDEVGMGEPLGLAGKAKVKKMRIGKDGLDVGALEAGAIKKVFNDDGGEMEVLAPLENFARESGREKGRGKDKDLPAASEEYVERVKARLNAVREEDKARDRERVREKHLKRRTKDRARSQEGQEAMMAPVLAVSSDRDSDSDNSDEPGYGSASSGEGGGDRDSRGQGSESTVG
ncbi:unnamed protein product, partial [Discosporangium mesarthrocarpum]